MKPLTIIGIVLIVLGIASFFVTLPRRESHGVSMGDAKIGVTTTTQEKAPPLLSGLLVAGGIVLMAASGRRS